MSLKCSIGKFKILNESAKTKLNEWSQLLNELKHDEEKCKKIQDDCNQTFIDLMENVRNLEKELFINELLKKKKTIFALEKMEIEFISKKVYYI